MLYKCTLLLLSTYVLCLQMQAQALVYRPLKAIGDIPDEFLTTSSHKYREQKSRISRTDKAYLRKAQKEFYLQSNFATDELLLSGKVLFNDELSQYLQKIAQVLLADEPKLLSQLRFYVLKSPVPNAFATHRGTIFVNLGLMARLENEAQLAYILAHEIAHFTHEHVIKRFVNDRQTQRMWNASQPGLIGAKLMLQSNYTQDSESEADLAGLNRLARTNYHSGKILEVFDILQHAQAPYQSLVLDWQALQNEYFTGEDLKRWYLSAPLTASRSKNRSVEASGRRGFQWQDDRQQSYLTTHPDPLMRKRMIRQHTVEKQSADLFIVSADDFYLLREVAQHELCHLYLNQAAYFDALYQVLALQKKEGWTPFLELCLSKTLYGIAKYKQADTLIHSLLNYHQVEGDAWRLYDFMSSLSSTQALMLAFTDVWGKHKKYPDETYYKAVAADLAEDLFELFPDFTQGNEEGDEFLQILRQLRLEKQFQPLYERLLLFAREAHKEEVIEKGKKSRKKKRLDQMTYHLGINKVVVFNPRYSRIDERPRRSGLEHIASERQQASLDSYILSSSQKLGLEVVLLDTKFMAPESDAAHFNDIALLSEWHQEKLLHANIDMICSNFDQLSALIEKYDTPYFVHMGAISLRSPIVFGRRLKWLALLVAPPLLPYGIYEMVKPREASIFYSLVYDLRSDDRIAVISDLVYSRLRDKDLYEKIYGDFMQIKREK